MEVKAKMVMKMKTKMPKEGEVRDGGDGSREGVVNEVAVAEELVIGCRTSRLDAAALDLLSSWHAS